MRQLFILRPEPAAGETVREAMKLGLDAVALPLFEIEPLDWKVPDPSSFDALLMTSANAVRSAGKDLDRLRSLPVHAVGRATAEAVRNAGLVVATVGNSGVEPLLRSIDPSIHLLHLCGEHRTEVSAPQRITALPVYRSVERPLPNGIKRIQGHTVAVHSRRAARRLAQLVGRQGVDRSTIRVAAISEPVLSAAGDGWERCEAASGPGSDAVLALAARLCDITGQE